jgi:hypothetical protein
MMNIIIEDDAKITEAQKKRLDTLIKKQKQINTLLNNILETRYEGSVYTDSGEWASVHKESADVPVYNLKSYNSETSSFYSGDGYWAMSHLFEDLGLYREGVSKLTRVRDFEDSFFDAVPRRRTRDEFETALKNAIDEHKRSAIRYRERAEEKYKEHYKCMPKFCISRMVQKAIANFNEQEYKCFHKIWDSDPESLSCNEKKRYDLDLSINIYMAVNDEKNFQEYIYMLKESLATRYIDREHSELVKLEQRQPVKVLSEKEWEAYKEKYLNQN